MFAKKLLEVALSTKMECGQLFENDLNEKLILYYNSMIYYFNDMYL